MFLAALIHDVGKPLADLHIVIAKQRGEGTWSPLAGTMAECGATRYRVMFGSSRVPHEGAPGVGNYAAHQRMGIFLLQRLVPQSTLAWLSEDAELLSQLTAFLSGEDKTNAVAWIVTQADRESVRLNLLTGPRTRFASARAVPLIERLMEALRRMLAEGGCLPLNRPGAAGFVADGQVWFVSKRLADEVRAYLAAHESAAGIPGPEKNDRLFDVWQEYGALVANPATGGAIWRVRVQADGFDQVLTLLRFPLEKLYSTPASYPANFAGRVIPLIDAREASLLASAEASAPTTAGAEIGSTPQDGGNFSPTVVSPSCLPLMPNPGGDPEPAPAADEFLEEDDTTHFLPRPPDGHRIAPMRLPDKPIKPDRLAKPKAAAQGPSEAALRFMGWLQQGLANGSIAHNETGAMVHFAAEGMLLEVFQRVFAEK